MANLVFNQKAQIYRKWINDTYYPPTPVDPSPVEPSRVNPIPVDSSQVNPSPVDPSQVNPSPSPVDPKSDGLEAEIIILIIVYYLFVVGGAAFAVWKFYLRKKQDEPQISNFGKLI